MSPTPHPDPVLPAGLQSASFGEIRLQPGSRVQLVLTRDDADEDCFTTVLGFARDEFLILRRPAAAVITTGQQLRVRVFSGIHLYEFAGRVLAVFDAPADYFHLSFPDDIRVTPVRMAPRVRAELPARVILADGRTHEGLLADISAQGAQLQVLGKHPLVADGGHLRISFTVKVGIDEHDHLVETDCTARLLQSLPSPAGDGELQTWGLHFGELEAGASLALQNFILRRMIEDQDAIV